MKILVVVLLWVCVISCSSEKKNSLLLYSLERVSAIDYEATSSLDSLVKEMEVVPLETTDSCLVNDVTLLKESEEYYFIYSEKNSKIFKFDKYGKFITTISCRGQGPTEYLSVKNLMVDETNKSLYVMDYLGRKIKVFDFGGKLLSTYPLPDDFAYTHCYLSLSDKAIYYMSANNAVRMDFMKFDLTTSEFTSYSKRDREMEKGEFFVGQSLFASSDSSLFVFHYFNDTVYQVKQDGLYPHHLLKLGERSLSWNDFKADAFTNPRPHVHKIQVWDMEIIKDMVCVFYTISRFQPDKSPTPLMAVYKLGKEGIIPHVNWVSQRFLPITKGVRFNLGFQRTTLLRAVFPDELEGAFKKKYNIADCDNPIILKYHLK